MAQGPSDRVSELASRFEKKESSGFLDLDAVATRRRGPSAMRPPAPAPADDFRRQSWAPGRAPPRKERARPPPRPATTKRAMPGNVNVTAPTSGPPRLAAGGRSPGAAMRSPPAPTLTDQSRQLSEGFTSSDGPSRVFGDTRDIECPDLEAAPLYPLIQQMERGSTTISEFAKSLGIYARSQIKQAEAMAKMFDKTKKHYADMDGMINFTFVLELVHQMLTKTVHIQAELAQYMEDVCLPIINNVIKTSGNEQTRITKDYRKQEKKWRESVNIVKKAQVQVNADAQQFRLQQDGQRKVGGLRGILKKKASGPGEMDREEQMLYERADESARRYKQAIGSANAQRETFLSSFFRSKQDIVNMESTRIQSVLAVLQKLMEKSHDLHSQPVIQQLQDDIMNKVTNTDPQDEVRKFVQETVAKGQWSEPDEFMFDVVVEYRDTWRSIDDAIEVTRETDPGAKVPRIVTTLCAKILELEGDRAEGIFRISGNKRTTDLMKKQLREGNYAMADTNPHLYAGLLKEWLRGLTEPLIPQIYYDVCVSMAKDGSLSADQFEVFLSQLPETNRETLKYLARFLRQLAEQEATTRMGLPNFALVFAPCFLRCISDDPAVMMANSDPEKEFVIALIENSLS